MPDTAFENAQKARKRLIQERDELQVELERIRRNLDEVDLFLHSHTFFSKSDDLNELEARNKNDTNREHKRARVLNSTKEEVAAEARIIIETRGEPVKRADMLDALINQGLTIEGENRAKVLSTMLWRMRDTIANIPRVGYWLAERDYLPAGFSAQLYLEALEKRKRQTFTFGSDHPD